MSCDKLVYDLAQEVEGSPNVFIRKDWLNILDNQNQNYQNNQSIIDTSQLANSNKYMAYREAYIAVPMLLSLRGYPTGATALGVGDYAIGLKNWFGTIIHSFTLDYNGTTIVQQTPFCNLWNNFKLLTTLSWSDIATQGCTIGFYPDTPDSFALYTAASHYGIGVVNNADGQFGKISTVGTLITNKFTQPSTETGISSNGGNFGLTMRTKWIAYNPDALAGTNSYGTEFLSANSSSLIWKSHISNKASSTANAGSRPILQISVMATIYLKHIHSFFNMCPLLKGVFMKLTMNLNNCRTDITTTQAANLSPTASCTTTSSYIGGTQVLMVPSADTGGYLSATQNVAGTAFYDLVVGSRCYNNDILQTGVANMPAAQEGRVSKSIYLYIPAYTFNPTFEQSYLQNSVKQIKYTDIYQYQVDIDGSPAGAIQFNNLITNGIANIKSVLIIPVGRVNIGGAGVTLEYLSPFSPCGGGTTYPMTALGNFNIQISGQNAIYNMQRYNFEEWNNQLYGQNAVNGGLTDGLTSGLIDFAGFQSSYAYYYVNVERMLPVEQSVPKSVQILGTSYCPEPLRLMVFIEYGVEVRIDVLTGARV